MVIWDVIEDTSLLEKCDEDIYNVKNIDSNNMHVTRPYKKIK
jgi:hypothetical protein